MSSDYRWVGAPFGGPIVGDKTTPTNVVLPVDGALGEVMLMEWRSRGPYVTINGKRAGHGNTFKVPLFNGGTAKVKIRALIPGAPRVTVDGVEVFTTPQPPVWLVVLAVMPILSVIFVRGIVVTAIAVGTMVIAIAVARQYSWSTGRRAGVVIALALAHVLATLLIVAVKNTYL